ncbi:DUF6279 family lipoprotein [Pseudaeromonas paramecii]|uniref:DUF6279 family lipoprotein n=1 Tax=Pseudaeromonas paramecii TaxID=2138166 RepID=A0ABP8QEQ3_9GAMM
MMRRCLLLCGLCLLLGGCSVRLMYHWLDWAIAWKLDDYFQLNSRQSRIVDHEVDRFLSWHRQVELPVYAKQLRQLADELKEPLSEARTDYYFGLFEGDLTRLADGVEPYANRIAASLQDEQVYRYLGDQRTKQVTRRSDWEKDGGKKLQQDFSRKLQKNLRRWIDDIGPAQQPIIAQWAAWQKELYPTWLDYQDVWLASLEEMLSKRGTPEFSGYLRRLLVKGKFLGNGRFEGYVDSQRQRTVRSLSQLSASLDEGQRQYLRKTLYSLANDFSALASR